jgi:uncharacterized Tic20 family protein
MTQHPDDEPTPPPSTPPTTPVEKPAPEPVGDPAPATEGEPPVYGSPAPSGPAPAPPPPAYGQPAYGQPTYGQPAYGQPGPAQPPYGQPGYGQNLPPAGSPGYGAPPPPSQQWGQQSWGQPGAGPHGGYPTPPPGGPAPTTQQEQRQWSMLAHLGGVLALWPVVPMIPALVIFSIYASRDEYIKDQAREALNFQIVVLILYVIARILGALPLFPNLVVLVWIFSLIFSVLGAVAAGRGHRYRYPLTYRFLS